MFKSALALITVMIFTAGMAASSMAASVPCTVTEINGNTATLDCGKKTGKLHVGDSVKVKAAKKKAIEGC